MSSDGFDLDYLRLSVQRALVGSVSPGLYGACASLDGNQITLDLVRRAGSDRGRAGRSLCRWKHGHSGLPGDYRIDERFVDIYDRDTPLKTVGDWVFLQRGFRTFERS